MGSDRHFSAAYHLQPPPSPWYFSVLGHRLPPAVSTEPAGFCAQPRAPSPGFRGERGLYEGHPRGEAISAGLPCLLTWGSVRQCGDEGAIQGEDLLPAACAARADPNPLPESEGKLSASAERTRGGRAREWSWPGCSCQGRRGPARAAKAGWGGRGRASWGRS